MKLKQMTGKQLLVLKQNCLEIIEKGTGAVELANIRLVEVEAELASRNTEKKGMKKLVFTDGTRFVVHRTSKYEIRNGVVKFYKDDVETLINYCCIDVEYLYTIEEE